MHLDEHASEQAVRLRFHPDQILVQDVINWYRNGQLNLAPGFQRASVWNRSDRSKLIESILRNYPLPSIFLYRHPTDTGELAYDVIDGKQRIETILMYTGATRGKRFAIRFQFSENEPPQWIDYRALCRRRLQHVLTGYKLQAIEVEGELDEIISLFVLINSTGKALTGAEKRNARYYQSGFLRKAWQLARRYEPYFRKAQILSSTQISRMKHLELVCELLVSGAKQDVIHKKLALDSAMSPKGLSRQDLAKGVRAAVGCLNRLRRMFPDLGQTRFRKVSDFYSLAVLIQKFEREGLILTERKRNQLAWDLLKAFGIGVDTVSEIRKKLMSYEPGHELHRDYLRTVLEGTDKMENRRRREQILRGLAEPIFQRKDSRRFFSEEQRRILWNSTAERKCIECGEPLTWGDFDVDHIEPYARGGQTELDNAAVVCRRCNARKGARDA